jgi:aminobenzoyl-glutamate transport protein
VKRFLPHIALTLVICQMLLMLVSWLFSAAYPTSGVRSLLSAEGLRWLMGHFSDLLATPLLVWIVLCSIAWGCLSRSCLLHRPTNYRERRAQFMALLLLGIIVGVMVLLTATPHAVLLSAVGGLWPSPFSASLVPVIAFSVTLISAFYGMVSGRFENISAVYDGVLHGICQGAPWLLFYVLVIQIYESFRFVLP